jgi:hypothetical protein
MGVLGGLLPLRARAAIPARAAASGRLENAFLGAPLVARGMEHAWRALLGWADACRRGPVPGRSAAARPLHAALADVLAQQGRDAALVVRAERAMLQSALRPRIIWKPRFRARSARNCAASSRACRNWAN